MSHTKQKRESFRASPLSLNEILQSLDALSEEERAIVQQYLETGSSNRSSKSLSTLLATWDESITIEDAEELNRLVRESRRSQAEPPRLELTE